MIVLSHRSEIGVIRLSLVPGVKNSYLFTGKEIQDELGLGWIDFGARMYDAASSRWNGVDVLGERYVAWSPYNYVMGSPLVLVDPEGDTIRLSDAFRNSQYLMDIYSQWQKTDYGKTFIEDFNETGKFGDVLISFDAGKENVTRFYFRSKLDGSLETIPGSDEGSLLSLSSSHSLYISISLIDFDSYERTGPFQSEDEYSIQFYARISGNDNITHETQHAKIGVKTIRQFKKHYSEKTHHEWMGKINSIYYHERKNTLYQSVGEAQLDFFYREYVKIEYYRWLEFIINSFPGAENRK
ncbi:MAG: RHS repeat-associated core domain-containing protein [Bacteroidia bacterium]